MPHSSSFAVLRAIGTALGEPQPSPMQSILRQGTKQALLPSLLPGCADPGFTEMPGSKMKDVDPDTLIHPVSPPR